MTIFRRIISKNGVLFAEDEAGGGGGSAPAGEILFGTGSGVDSDPNLKFADSAFSVGADIDTISIIPVARPNWVTLNYGSNTLHSYKYSNIIDTEQVTYVDSDWGGFSVGRFAKLTVNPDAGANLGFYAHYVGSLQQVSFPNTNAGDASLVNEIFGSIIGVHFAGTGTGPGTLKGLELLVDVTEDAVNLSGTQVTGLNFVSEVRAGAFDFVNSSSATVFLRGTATANSIFGSYNSLAVYESAHVDNAYFYYAYRSGANNGDIDNAFVLWSDDQAGLATNNYFLWNNSPGVFRVKADGVMAYYNPSFAKYTPGANAFERVVQQWTSDVLEYGTEVGPTQTLTSLSSATTTATATKTNHGYRTGDVVTIADADQSEYNGPYTVTRLTADTFSYTFAGSMTSPATGTITAQSGTARPLRFIGPSVDATAYKVGGTAGDDATIVIPAVGTITVVKGIVTDFTPV